MDFVAEIRKQYGYLTESDASKIVARAKMYYFRRKYPYEPSADDTTRPIVTFTDTQWILEACDELIEKLGFGSAVAYKENGISWTFDNAKLSLTLLSLLIPVAGSVKR